MRIALIGKYPPIQGGVSMRTYWTAHALAARGHDVHVITNAREAIAPHRLHMRPQDWLRCEAGYGAGSVRVHWTEVVDPSQSYLPMASPFVSKLASLAAAVHAERPLDVILSYYLEPYAVAGHLAADMTGVPHVVRMAGSDAGRLWRHAQLQPLYDHVLRRAQAVIAAGPVAERALACGVAPERIVHAGGFAIPEQVFAPDGPVLDLAGLRQELVDHPDLAPLVWGEFTGQHPHLVLYGKLGQRKGSFALLAALQRLKQAGIPVGLVAPAHGTPAIEARFRARAAELGLTDRVLQLPYLPHWRIPDLLRGALAVCCLEQDFPISFHTPIIPLEVLLCGRCLVASTEVLRKLPGHAGLPDGYGCIAIRDVQDVDALAGRLASIAGDPERAALVGQRGHAFAVELQKRVSFPHRLEAILAAAVSRVPLSPANPDGDGTMRASDRFPFARLAAAAIAAKRKARPARGAAGAATFSLPRARRVLAAVERRVRRGEMELRRWLAPLRAEIAVATAESDANATVAGGIADQLFRYRGRDWALGQGEIANLFPLRDPRMRVLDFDNDVSGYGNAANADRLPEGPVPGRSHVLAFAQSDADPQPPLLVDGRTADVLRLADGNRTAAEIATRLSPAGNADTADLALIERLFAAGLLWLHDRPNAAGGGSALPSV